MKISDCVKGEKESQVQHLSEKGEFKEEGTGINRLRVYKSEDRAL